MGVAAVDDLIRPSAAGPCGGGSSGMLAKLFSYTLVGIDATPVEVEVDVSPTSMPKTVLVGLAEAAVRESTHRVERAIVNSGYRRPMDRIVINLAPADLRKDAGGAQIAHGSGFLPMPRSPVVRMARNGVRYRPGPNLCSTSPTVSAPLTPVAGAATLEGARP